MKKINLKSSELISKRKHTESESNTSLLLGVLIILISLGAYGAVMFLNSSAKGEIGKVNDDIEILKKKMDSDETQEVYDFQDRLFEIEELLGTKIMNSENLEQISLYTLPETRFTSLTAEVNEDGFLGIIAEVVNPDHYSLSQQLEAYSMMERAEDVMLDQSEQGEEGIESKIEFTIRN